MRTRRIDVLFIDFYGTIASGDADVVARVCRSLCDAHALAVTPSQLAERWGRRFFAAVDLANQHAFRSLYDLECATLVETLEPLCGPIDPRPHVDRLTAYWRKPPLHSDARSALESLDLPVCCVSNADDADLREAVKHLGLKFDHIVTSESAGCYKPAPAIFKVAMSAMDVGPDRVLHVGDSLHSDIGGAKACGIQSAWICREGRIYDIGQSQPDHKLRSLNELRQIVSVGSP